MPCLWPALLTLALVFSLSRAPQEAHTHNAPERLGAVTFPISCAPSVQQQFNRGVALLHSFAYHPAEEAFRKVVEQDPRCAIAHWGIAMTHFYQLWDPPLPSGAVDAGQRELQQALAIGAGSDRERAFINALNVLYQDAGTVPYRTRALNYERAMSEVSANNRNDVEAQVFYALALLANASPSDKTHTRQKQAADLLEPLDRAYPRHPGIPHYLIHAYDNAELAPRGLSAARAYSTIAPSAPHALHMPSHIFTRVGLWDDSIASNLAARDAAHQQGDLGEELHSMDYLVYAYLQAGRDADAAQVIQGLADITKRRHDDFKASYALTAMPIRYAVERGQSAEAAKTIAPVSAPPHVIAIAVWARGLGLARTGHPAEASPEIAKLRQLQDQLRASSNDYWAAQVQILSREVEAWSAQAQGKPGEATVLLRQAADDEDAIEKLPVTPGPILPAREQLGYLLLDQNQPDLASKAFATALANAPGRRGALLGAARAAVTASH
jgi:tetratricopeptide (TPR) repeat protein